MASGSERPRVAIATCAEVPGLDREGRLLLASMLGAGLDAEPAVWDSPEIDWERFDRVLLRSTWDYPSAPAEFARWVDRVGPRLINRPELVRWNLSKRYLEEVGSWGVPVVPSRFLAPGEPLAIPDGEFVIKPAISAGSRDTARYRADEIERAREHADSLWRTGREVLVQPYLGSVDSEAETAVISLGGEISHAMRKGPLLELDQELEQELFRAEEMSRRRARADELELASGLLARLGAEIAEPAYARVDLLRSESGEPLVLELELIEPSLFFDHHPPAAERLSELVLESLR